MYGSGVADVSRRGFLIPDHYSYSGEVFDLSGEDIAGQPVGELVLKDVTRKESGKYSILATSPRGSANSSFTVDVLCE